MDTGRGGARRCSRVLVVDREREREQRGIGTEGEIRESERVRGGRVASPGSSGGKQGGRRWPKQGGGGRGAWPRAPGACSSSWHRRKATEKEVVVGWAAGGAGPGKWAPGKSFCSFFKFSVLFYFYLIFCHCFEFKTIQTMPKTPLNIFILLDGLFQKLIKYFRGI